MDAFTTFAFYTSSYYGDSVDESLFPKYLAKATDKLNYLTFGNITDDTLATYATQVSKATCALIDTLYGIDQSIKNATSTEGSNIKSMSSGGRSVTFGDNSTTFDKAMASTSDQIALMVATIEPYLAGTGLMYAGVDYGIV